MIPQPVDYQAHCTDYSEEEHYDIDDDPDDWDRRYQFLCKVVSEHLDLTRNRIFYVIPKSLSLQTFRFSARLLIGCEATTGAMIGVASIDTK
jgi:hypothetical protein